MAVTAEDVSLWAKFTAPADGAPERAQLERVIAAVTATLSRHFHIDDPLTADQHLAITMQSARLWRRRDTPEGIAAFADITARRITGLDGDVVDLLDARFNFA